MYAVGLINKDVQLKKDATGNWELKILRKDCDFMNYLINASRVNWKEEIKDLKPSEVEAYLKEHNFCLDNYKTESSKAGLDDDQVYEQELHFINKVYAFGYMLHRYKDPSKAWCVYVMDNEVVDDNESHGRTGKSLLWNMGMRLFVNSKYIGARKKNILENDFLYDGITEQTDYVLFDDADKRFQFNNLFTDVTGDLNVNPKNQNAYLIPFHQSPKFAITTNYAPFGLDTSTKERLLFVAYSDYYHGESDAVIVKGIVSLLVKVLSGCTPDEIINSDLHFIDQIGLKEHLSPTRSNGLLAMVKQMKLYALAYKTKYAKAGKARFATLDALRAASGEGSLPKT
jgi:hypothetical protein